MDSVVLQGLWERPGGFILHGARVQLVLRVRKKSRRFFCLVLRANSSAQDSSYRRGGSSHGAIGVLHR